jgi:hypothetical protein
MNWRENIMPPKFDHSNVYEKNIIKFKNAARDTFSKTVCKLEKIKDCYKYFNEIEDAGEKLKKFSKKAKGAENFKVSLNDNDLRDTVNQLEKIINYYYKIEGMAKSSNLKLDMLICSFFYLTENILEEISESLFEKYQKNIDIDTFKEFLKDLQTVKKQRSGTESYREGTDEGFGLDEFFSEYREGGTGLENS